MKILYGSEGAESPFEAAPRAAQRVVIGGSSDHYGACSIETLWYVGSQLHPRRRARLARLRHPIQQRQLLEKRRLGAALDLL